MEKTVVAALVTASSSSSSSSHRNEDLEWQEIDLFSTSDCHSHFETTNHEQYHPNEPKRAGSMAKRASFLSERRRSQEDSAGQKRPLAVFDCGDALMGTLYFDLFNGEAELRSLKKLGYNAICCGNHDWDNGVKSYLDGLIAASNDEGPSMSILCCNIICHGEHADTFNRLFKRFDIIQVGKVKMGIFGVIGFGAFDCTAPKHRKGLEFVDLESSYRAVVGELRKLGCDAIVCLSHAGHEEDKLLVAIDDGADVIFGGHSHKKYKAKAEIITSSGPARTRVILHQAPPLGVAFARATLRVRINNCRSSEEHSEEESKKVPLVELIDSGLDFFDDSIEDDPVYSKWLDDNYRNKVNEIGEEVLGECKVDWLEADPRQRQLMYAGLSPLGRFLGQFVADFHGATIGMLNRGGIKTGFSRGLIKRKNICEIFGNNDSIMMVDMKGCRLRILYEYANNKTSPEDATNNSIKNNSIQFSSSIQCSAHDNIDNAAIDEVLVNGVPLNDNHWYSVAINDYSFGSLLEQKWFIPPGSPADQFMRVHERTLEKQIKWQQTFPKYLCDRLGKELTDERLFGLHRDLHKYANLYLNTDFVATFKLV